MKKNKFTILIIGFIIVTLGAFLKITKIDHNDYFIWLGLIIELIGIIYLLKINSKTKN